MKHTVDAGVRRRAIERCRERKILIPTFAQMRSPAGLDPSLLAKLTDVDMQAVHPLNLFRITWRNNPVTGGFGSSGVPDIIICLGGRFIAIECKAGNNKPTVLQQKNLDKIVEVGGVSWVVNEENMNTVYDVLNALFEK